MTEIPEHLLQRSRDRRAALGLGGADGPAPAAAPAASAAAPVPAAAAASPAPARAEAAPVPAKVVAPPPPHVEAALKRKKVPFWAMPVLLGLPIWAYAYVGTLEDPPQEPTGLVAEGTALYSGDLACAGCHGAGGGGGVGPAFSGGAILETFSDPVDHLEWVIKGSANWGQPTYGDPAKPVNGGMPSFATATPEQILSVIMYERAEFGDPAQAELALAIDEALAAGELELPESWSTDVTSEELHTLLDPYLNPEG